jgi:hypothetical protein
MRKHFLSLMSLILFVTALAPVLHAEWASKEKQKRERGVIFAPQDRRIINDYFRVNTSNLPPGLAKRGGNLPPGLQKQIRRNGQLPPGLQNRVNPFPIDLERQLPALPSIYRRGTIGDRAIIYDPNTMAIMDIIQILTRR